jgi:hypothetical protein
VLGDSPAILLILRKLPFPNETGHPIPFGKSKTAIFKKTGIIVLLKHSLIFLLLKKVKSFPFHEKPKSC